MKIAITGVNGFIGGAIYREFSELGYDIRPLSRSLVHGLDDQLQGIDVLIHQAANNDTLSVDNYEMMKANFYDPQELFQKAIKSGCKKIVYASTAAVYGNSPAPYTEETPTHPLNIYAKSKLLFDQFTQTITEIPVIGLRYSNVYGPGESHKGRRASMIGQIIDKMIAKKRVRLFKFGQQKRDWVYIRDVVAANLGAMRTTKSGIYNIGSGKATSFNKIYELIAEHFGSQPPPEYIDNPYPGAFQNHTECDNQAACRDLGYYPFMCIDLGITSYVKHKLL